MRSCPDTDIDLITVSNVITLHYCDTMMITTIGILSSDDGKL